MAECSASSVRKKNQGCRSVWLGLVIVLVFSGIGMPVCGRPAGSQWQVGTPIATYYQGPGCGAPPRFELLATAVGKLADSGFNLVWCQSVADLDTAHAHGLRGMVQTIDPTHIDDPQRREGLAANIDMVKDHPAMYAYYIDDEPSATEFPALGRLIAFIRERDPKHLAYINLFPTYASAGAQGTSGDKVTAYREYLRRFIEEVKPDLISYDHYHMRFTDRAFDGSDYFLNLALVREAALEGGLPFLNVVQACANGPGWRTPNGDEGRYLAFTTLAYGGQGIAQFVYNAWEGAEHWGGVENPDGTLTPLGESLHQINPEFVAVGEVLQPLTSLGAYHLGVVPSGAVGLPPDASFTVDPAVAPEEVNGILLGYFGTGGTPSHVLVVNLDYSKAVTTTVVGPGPMEVFDAATGEWHPASDGARAQIRPMLGGGKLVRLRGAE